VFNSSPAQTGELATREFSVSRKLRLKVTRTACKSGLQSFVFEIASGNQRIEVPEHLMDSLRKALSEVCAATQEQLLFKPQYVTFDGKNVFRIELENSPDAATSVHIADLVHPARGERIVIPLADLASFVTLLFEDSFAYPSGCLERVMSYHSLLQLAFPKVSSSLNATMGHRPGFLCFEITNPKLLDPQLATEYVDGSDGDEGRKGSKAKDVTQKAAPPKDFKLTMTSYSQHWESRETMPTPSTWTILPKPERSERTVRSSTWD
jgi:hypothetical protein